MITLRQLELLVAMFEAGGISSGGGRIGMSPSATSHALRALESQLGVAVVNRQSKDFALTSAGERVLRHSRDIFTSMKTIEQEGKAAAELKTGVLRIGSFGASSSIRLLPALLDQFKIRYPGVEIFVIEEADNMVEQRLIEGRVDLGVVVLPKPQFDTLSLAVDELVAVLPKGHELEDCERVDLRDLVKYNFILTHAGSQGLVQKIFDRAGVQPRVTHQLSQLWSILDFVSRGQGISMVASLALPDLDHFPGIVTRPVSPRANRSIGIACRDEARLALPAKALWRIAREAASHNRATTRG